VAWQAAALDERLNVIVEGCRLLRQGGRDRHQQRDGDGGGASG
jgi:hypothetical protein